MQSARHLRNHPDTQEILSPRLPQDLGSTWTSGKNQSPNPSGSKIRSHSYRKRNKYAQFEVDGDTDFVMTQWDVKESQAAQGVTQTTVVVGGESRSKSDDDSSEKGIMERRSVVVERE